MVGGIALGLIESFGGMMGVNLGNSAIVLFGAPRTLEDHAVQACRAALALRSAIAANSGGELALSACLDAGEVLVRAGAAGIETIGPAIQTAAQLVHPLPAGMTILRTRCQRVARNALLISSRDFGVLAMPR